ncbi:MAG: hypothetical protein J6Y37_06785 [Paludibacteraceae bacterium]|nr:hypothetical protein [Paludibacteraceae bacterium]
MKLFVNPNRKTVVINEAQANAVKNAKMRDNGVKCPYCGGDMPYIMTVTDDGDGLNESVTTDIYRCYNCLRCMEVKN